MPTYAISTNYKLAVNDEAVWGTAVTTGAEYLRIVDSNFKPDLGFVDSNEINSAHRQTPDTVNVSAKGSGSVKGEVSYKTYDRLFQSLFGAAYAVVSTVRTLKIGKTPRPLTIQEEYSDLTTTINAYRGAFVNSCSINVQVGQLINLSFGFMSKKPTMEAASVIGTPAAANTNPIMSPIADVRVIQEGASLVTLAGVSSITISLQNDITELMVLGSADPAFMTPGRIRVTGSISVFKADAALLTKFIGVVVSKFLITLGGASTLNYTFSLANIKFTSYATNASQSTAITETFGFSGLYDSTDSALKIIAND